MPAATPSVTRSSPNPVAYRVRSIAIERLPAFMKETTPQGVERVAVGKSRDRPPEAVFVEPYGRLCSEGDESQPALNPRDFLFCCPTPDWRRCLHNATTPNAQTLSRRRASTKPVARRRRNLGAVSDRLSNLHWPSPTSAATPQALLSFNHPDTGSTHRPCRHFNDFRAVALLRPVSTQIRKTWRPRGSTLDAATLTKCAQPPSNSGSRSIGGRRLRETGAKFDRHASRRRLSTTTCNRETFSAAGA